MRFAMYGAGGHSKEVADLLSALGHSLVAVVDDRITGDHATAGIPVSRSLEGHDFDAVVIAVGDCSARRALYETLSARHSIPTLVHPTAVISPSARIAGGCQIMQHVVVNADAVVDEDCILNVACHVAHDCSVGAHTHMAPGSRLGGGSALGAGCLCGTSSVLLPGVSVGRDCSIGAGAVVTRDAGEGLTLAGVPARVMRSGSVR